MTKNALAALLLFILLFTILSHPDHDDTDDPNGWRSGMIIYTDYKTGCQYLGTIFGGITSRLDKDGKPVCVSASRPKP